MTTKSKTNLYDTFWFIMGTKVNFLILVQQLQRCDYFLSREICISCLATEVEAREGHLSAGLDEGQVNKQFKYCISVLGPLQSFTLEGVTQVVHFKWRDEMCSR